MVVKMRYKKLFESAVAPKHMSDGAAGFDLTAVSCESVGDIVCYGTGLAFEIPQGHVGLLFPRSSVANKKLILSNCVGVIDEDYRGEVMFKYRRIHDGDAESVDYQIGERVGQMVVVKRELMEFEEVGELSDTVRGTGGFGSTGK